MAAPPNVELEAAKFLQKLIQESKDEPTKLATKLHVILKHMRSSGKENSMPYQVISRAMETVINQHGLDINALMSSHIPSTTGTQVVDSASSQYGGSSLRGAVAMEANTSLVSNDMTKSDSYASNRPPVGPSFAGHDIYQGSASQLNSKTLDHESPSSFDTRSAKSHSEESRDPPKWEKAGKKKDNKKGASKRKRADPSSNSESQYGNIQPLESSTFNSGMDKAATMIDQPRSISIQGGEHAQFHNMVQSSSTMDHNAMRSTLRVKQDIQHATEKSLDSTNISNSLSRTLHSRHPEEVEVSSTHNGLSRQQGVSLPVAHDVLNTRGVWNQSKISSPFENSQYPRFSFHTGGDSSGETLLHQSSGTAGEVNGMSTGTSVPYAAAPGFPGPVQFSDTYNNPSLRPKMHKDNNPEQLSSASAIDLPSDKGAFGKALEHEGGSLHASGNDNSIVQSGMLNNVTEMALLRNTGKLPVSQSSSASVMPFKEQHLKQLRAQCLVYLAFRNGLKPKKLHLDFALGNFISKDEGLSKEMIDQKVKEQLIDGTRNTLNVPMSSGRLENSRESESFSVDPSSEYMTSVGEKNAMPTGATEYGEESRQIMMTRRKPESEMQTREIAQSQISAKGAQTDGFNIRGSPRNNHKDDIDIRHQQLRSMDQASSVMTMSIGQMQTEATGQTGNSCNEEASKFSLQSSTIHNECEPERIYTAPSQSFSLADRNFQGSRPADAYLPSFPSSAHWKPLSRVEGGNHMVSPDDSKISYKSFSSSGGSKRVPVDNALDNVNSSAVEEHVPEEEDSFITTDLPPLSKYTTTEKWIIDQQRRKLLQDKTWELKQQRTLQRITACSDKLKDNVSSSEDISAKTRSVIELKKLQLLELQSRLRNDILNDFFRPIASDMDRLKSIKKHRIGRRSKQLEKYEQKMKEERQKRFRERQKEFFSEIEIHKERLEDVFKIRRERCKGFNRSVREFHKRKERVHREKIDRIQREKINLLKINDVEGYLRMVQDAKSDRVKQLLKETEKYLQKLGSKLRDAKVISRCFETSMDDTQSAVFMDKNEMTIDNEDETDQAKHYLESNEKYYLMAHSIKENVAEQPTGLVGGKLREYQMNGLRWLVSLYNNHLNGILADEMGLGKTVQVISLICYLMENKNDRGPFLVVVPSSVLPGWNSEIDFWAPSINKIVYSGPPEERRRLFKERIVPQKFNVLLTTYEYLMNKHDRPKLSKIHWHYVIIDEGHRIKNASCKLNADLKLYHSSHRLLLTGTPLQNNLEELWALLNFLLPNIFNSSEDFSQWFNKPFESNGDSSPDEALLSEEENLLIINRLHQVLRPFVLRRLKHKVENELPEKIERLVRCEASGYQKLLMKRVEDNLGAFGTTKARSVHNSVMELRNICNHPYLSQLHSEEVHDYIPKHYLPNIVRLCGKLEMLDRILPKLKATDHRVLLFSTMTRLLDVMEDYLYWKQYKYLRLDGHTSGGDRGALIDQYNKPDSPYFIFLLSIRAGGVGVNLQAADTVIIFDTDWNPQVDLQAQARAHRIGQKREVLVLRFETVQTVEEQVRAAAEHKLGVANQSITAGFFDNNTSAEDRREYLESLLRECKKEEAAPVLHDDAVNDLIARSESEIDIFESIDKRRQEEEMAAWKLTLGERKNSSEPVLTLPSRLVTTEDLKSFSEAMKIYDAPTPMDGSNVGIKRKSGYLGGLDTQHYGRGKRAREVRSYEEQWTEDEFEKLCQTESPHSPKMKNEVNEMNIPVIKSEGSNVDVKAEMMVPSEQPTQQPFAQSVQPPLVQLVQPLLMKTTDAPGVHSTQLVVGQSTNLIQQELQSPVVQAGHTPVSQAGHPPNMQSAQQSKEITPKRGRGRPKRATTQISPSKIVGPALSGAGIINAGSQTGTVSNPTVEPSLNSVSTTENSIGTVHQSGALNTPSSQPSASPNSQPTTVSCPVPIPDKRRGNKGQSGGETTRRRGRKPNVVTSNTQVPSPSPRTDNISIVSPGEIVSTLPSVSVPSTVSAVPPVKDVDDKAILSLSSGNIKPQNAPVSSSPILSIPTVAVGVSVATNELHKGTTDSEQKLPFCPLPHDSQSTSVGTGTSSVPNPQFSTAPQSVSSSQVVPKQVKGRGRKAQTEGETPGRRGRRPKGASTELPGGSGGKELTSTEPPLKKSRVSSGRTTIASRRKQQNETQNLVNVSQANASNVQTSDSVVGLDLSNLNDRHNQCIKNENNQSTSSAVAVDVASPLKEFPNVKMIQPDVIVSGDRILLTEMEVCHSVEVASPSKESANVKVIQADVPVSEDDITFSREKAANVKVIQPDAPVSGDGVLLTDTEVSQSRVDPGRIEIRDLEVNGDTQSLEFQSAISEILPLNHSASSAIGSVLSSEIGTCDAQTNAKGSERVDETTTASQGTLLTQNSPTNDSESKRKAADDVSCAEELADIKIVADCGISGGARIDTLTDICEDQNLEDRKSLPLSNMETGMDTQIYGNTSNLAVPILETGQVSDVVNVESLLEEKSGEKLEEVTNAFPDGSVPPVSEVHKFESPRISDVCIQNVADINITQKSFRGEGAIQYVSEKPLDSEDCVVNITGNMVSYNEGKLVDEGNAMVESRENVDSFEVSTASDGTKQDLVGSSGPDDMSETVEGAITVVAGDEDGSAGLVGVDNTLVKDVSPSSSLECASEKPDMTVDAVVAPEYNTGGNAASVKSEPEGHYEATEFSKPKVLHEEDEKEAHRTTKVGSDPLSGDAIEGKESKSSENVIGIFDEVNTKEISRQDISGITQFCDPAFEIRQPSEDAPVRQCSTQTAEEVLYRPTESINETKETENVISDGQTCIEAKFVENMEIIVETVQYERLEQQGSQILHDTGETLDVLEQNQTHTEVSQDEKMQVLKATEPNWSEHKEVGLVCVVEQKVVETGHTEELLDVSRRDTSAEVQNFQEATSHDRREHEDRLLILPLNVSENVDVLHLGPKTTAEVGPRLEVFTKEQCQIQAEEDSNSSETSKVPGETSNNKMAQVETIVTNNMEVMVEVEKSLEAVASLQCQTQMDRDGEVSNEVKFSCEQRQSPTKEDSESSENTKNVPGETICVIMDRGDEVMHDNEVTIEVGQRLETLSAQQRQAQMEKDLEASEKVELFSEQHEMQAEGDLNPAERYKDVAGESTCGIEEQGNETMHDNMEVSIGVGQILEEPYIQQCRTVMKDDCEAFEKVDPLQEAAKNEASDKHEGEVLHSVVDTEAEICRTTEELSGKQSKTKGRQGGEVSPSILEEIAHDASLLKDDMELETGSQISQRLVRESEYSEACDKEEITCEATEHERREEVAAGGVLHATEETAESICQKMEAEQCQLEGSGDAEPSKKVELLPEAIEHERREEVAGRSLHITEEATASIGQLEEFAGQSQTPVNKEVKPSEVVEAFKDQTGHDENQQGCNVSSHTLGEISAALVHTECQIEEKVAVRLDDGEEILENDGMDLQTSLVIDSGGENVLEIGTKNVSEPDQICEEKCVLTGCTKDTDKDELEIDVHSSIGAGEQGEEPPTEHVAE